MSDRNDILEALKTELKEIQPGDANYTSSIAEVKRGYYGWSDAVNKPMVCIVLLTDDVEEETFSSGQIRRMHTLVYGFMDSDHINNYDKVHALVRDIEYWLKNDFSHANNTYVKKISIVEGGVSAPYSYFEIAIEVVYNQSL